MAREQSQESPEASVEPSGRASRRAPALAAGTMVDHFKVMRLIGRGGMGEVYLARDIKLGRRAALKVVSTRALGSPEALAAFQREARTTARFNHPNIVTLHAVGEHEGRPYVALEYLKGEDLGTRIAARAPGLAESLRISLAIARALEEAHRHGVLHLDLKPSNVVIPADGRPRVVDFGLAMTMHGPSTAAAGSPSPSSSDSVWGTPVYTAPERWRREPNQRATDLWALGVIMFELCTHQLPFTRESPIATRDAILGDDEPPTMRSLVDVPRPLDELVARCLARCADDRPSASDVVATLERVLGTGRAPAPDKSPFRGLLPFDQQHADLFFGRDADIDAFVERVRHQPVLPVVGPSGAGKSSFVHAGVIPRLREQEPWVVLHIRPGSRPFVTLADRLRRRETETFARSGEIEDGSSPSGHDHPTSPGPVDDDGTPVRDTDGIAALLAQTPATLALTLRRIAEEEDAKVMLVVDQLEELCTMVDDEGVRRDFMQTICEAADDPLDPVRVIFTVRDDFLGRISLGPSVREALAQVTVISSLQETALEDIVRKPVEAVGYGYEDPRLVPDIIRAVAGEPGCLPLLQFAGQMLWDRRDRGRRLLLRSAYERMGGVAGALAQHADEVLAELSDDEHRIARRLLLLLVSPQRTRRVVGLESIKEQLGDAAEPVLRRLTHSRLLSMTRFRDAADEGPRVELAHESLIHTWSRLARWVDESREELGLLADATAAAELWAKRGRRPAELWQGDALHDATRTLARLAFEPPPTVARFIAASRAREHARSRRRWILLGTAVALLVGVAVTAVFMALLIADKERAARLERNAAQVQRSVAQQEREHAQQQRAVALREGARAAQDRDRPLEARAKLRMALEKDDGADARGLWWTLCATPALWQAEVGTFGLSIAHSPDGSTIATGCQDVALCLFDAATRDVQILRGHEDKVAAVAFSGDGRTVAAGDWAGRILLWDVATRRITRTLEGHRGRVMAVAFDPTGRHLASAGRDRDVRVWSLDDTAPSRVFAGHHGGIEGVAFSPDGSTIASGSEDKTARLWDLGSGKALEVLAHDSAVEDVAFTPDGTQLVSASNDGSITQWDVRRGRRLRRLEGHAAGVRSLSFSRDGTRLASGSYDGAVTLWDVEDGSALRSIAAHRGSARDVSISPDGRHVASTGYDGFARLWNVDAIPRPVVEEGHASAARGVDFSPDGSVVASGGFDHDVRLWDADTGEPIAVLEGHRAAVYGVHFSPDGRWLASASTDGTVRLWDAQTHRAERVLRGHEAAVYTVHFSPDSASLATGSRDQTVRLWDVATGDTRQVLPGHEHVIWDVRFGPRGDRVASASWDFSVGVWDARTGRRLHRLTGHESAVYGVAFAPGGRYLATSSVDRTVRLWDLEDGTGRVLASTGRGTGVDVHPSGQRVAVAMMDGSVRVWTVDGNPALVLDGHSNQVSALRHSVDGTKLATAADDGIVRVWNAESGRPHWRAPILLMDPPRLSSHRGWLALDDAPLEPPRAHWATQAVLEARLAEEDLAGAHLCVRTYDDRVQRWNLREDRLVAEATIPGLQDVRAFDEGCITRSPHGVRLYAVDDRPAVLWKGPSDAIGVGAQAILVAADGVVRVFSDVDDPSVPHEVGRGVSALTRTEDMLIVGYTDGTLAALPLSPDAPSPADFFEHAPPGPVSRIIAGPMGTIIAGYADGTLGLWNMEDGANLARARLHGPIVHLVLHRGRLTAASDLGRFVTWDLSVFHRSYCDVLQEVWASVPIVWEGGRAVERTPPDDHPCAP